jgi:hypothetical protein
MESRILGQKCPNIARKQARIPSRERPYILMPRFQRHRPKHQEQAGRKKSDGAWRHVGLHSGAKVLVNHVNKDHQTSELDKLRPSNLMTLQRCHTNKIT